MNRVLFFLLLLTAGAFAEALAQSVTINLNISPPFTPYLADYLSPGRPVTLQLRNNTRETLSLTLLLSFSGDNGVSIRTRPGYTPVRPLVLNPGEVRLLKSLEEFRHHFDDDNLDAQGISPDQLRSGGLPEGSYQLCVQAVESGTGRVLSFGEPVGCSNWIQIWYVEPPTLIYPAENQTLGGSRSQPIMFTWAGAVGVTGGAVYTFRLVELPDAPDLNPNAYLDAVTVPFFEQHRIRQPRLLYNASQPPLKPGRRYACRVTASDPQRRITFLNDGHSVVSTFVYAPD